MNQKVSRFLILEKQKKYQYQKVKVPKLIMEKIHVQQEHSKKNQKDYRLEAPDHIIFRARL